MDQIIAPHQRTALGYRNVHRRRRKPRARKVAHELYERLFTAQKSAQQVYWAQFAQDFIPIPDNLYDDRMTESPEPPLALGPP